MDIAPQAGWLARGGPISGMSRIRLIPRLDIKGPNLIKGVHLEGLRKLGAPHEFAIRYYEGGADELLYMDVVASLYGRNSLTEFVKRTIEQVFIPLTVGGGIRSVADVGEMLDSGADKVAINTQAIRTPELISRVAHRFGSQCIVLGVEAIRRPNGGWEAYTDNGREHTGLDVVTWVKQAQEMGAGEILLTSVDMEGTRKGFDIELARAVCDAVTIPVIISGGLGKPEHLVEVVEQGHADAVAIADVLHYKRHSLSELRDHAAAAGVAIRQP